MTKSRFRWAALIAANVLFCCVLSFYRTTGAAPQSARQPFANAVEQRNQMIRELQQINTLLKEQNALLRSQNGQDATSDRQNR